jgi:hypothetical protein
MFIVAKQENKGHRLKRVLIIMGHDTIIGLIIEVVFVVGLIGLLKRGKCAWLLKYNPLSPASTLGLRTRLVLFVLALLVSVIKLLDLLVFS